MKNKYIINLENICKNYKSANQKLEILKKLSLKVSQKEIIIITGESGSGKSTLLNLIGGLDKACSGFIEIANQNLNNLNQNQLCTFRANNIGFIFQFHHLLEDFTACENIMLPMLNKEFNKKKAKSKALYLLNSVHLYSRANHKPKELSGGEKQRIAIARSLINNPKIILADEPTGNLDEKNSTEIQKLLINIHQNHNITLILVSHNTNILKENRNSIMKMHQKKLTQI